MTFTSSPSSSGAPAWLASFVRHLESVVERNERLQASQEVPCTLFHGTGPAPISPEAYLERIFRYSHCSPVCFIAAGIYMERLAEKHPALEPTSLNLHRLLFTGVVIAIKFFDDKYYSNGFYAKVGGVSRSELNLLELEMLQLMNFNAYVGVEDVQRYLAFLSASQAPPVPMLPTSHTPVPTLGPHHPLSRPSSGMMSECGEGSGPHGEASTSPCDSSSTGFDAFSQGRVSGHMELESPQSQGGVLAGFGAFGVVHAAAGVDAAYYKQALASQQQYFLQQQQAAQYQAYETILALAHPQNPPMASYGPYSTVYGDSTGF